MKILITGGAGYIGSILCSYLLKQKYEITVVDNFLYNQNSLNHHLINKKLNVIKADVRDINSYKHAIKSSDVIIPLAALVGAPVCSFDPIGSKSINYSSVINTFKILSKNQYVLMPTTNSAYGSGAGKNNYCDESSKLNPISNYAKEKVRLEKILMNRENSVSFRLATVFGASPRMRVDLLVNDFVYRAYKDNSLILFEGNFKRNYIHVRDVSRVFIYALNNFSKFKNNIFNVGLENANLPKIELCEKIKKFIPNFQFSENKINKDPDQRNYLVSNKKLYNTNFRPVINIESGIKELIKLYSIINNSKYSNLL